MYTSGCTVLFSLNIIFSERKTLGIQINPDGSVVVKAPVDTSKQEIHKKVKKRASWIIKQQDLFKLFGEKVPRRRYINGETHLYLGRQYRLYVREGKPNRVSFKGRCFEIVCSSKNRVESLMKEWYKERAKVKFPEIAEPLIQQFRKYGVEPHSLYIQFMENRVRLKGKSFLTQSL